MGALAVPGVGTPATLSNFLVNGAAGTLVMSLQLVQSGGVALREAAFAALAVNVVAVVLAIVAILVAIPRGRKEAEASPAGR